MQNSTKYDQIIDALETLLTQKPIQDISVSEIAQTAGIAKGGIYYYFSSKNEILEAMIERKYKHPLETAKHLAENEDFDRIKEEAVSLLKYINDMEIAEIVTAIKRINEYKLDVNSYMDILFVWFRDILLFKATKEPNDLIFKEEIQYIRKIADRSSYEGIETILNALDKTQQRIAANVNFDLAMELLFLTVKENS